MERLLALLNTSPVFNSVEEDTLADPAQGRSWAKDHGGNGTVAELEQIRQVRGLLQAVVRGRQPSSVLTPLLDGVYRTPQVNKNGLSWTLVTEPDSRLAVEMIQAWSDVEEQLPGRLRPCENDECRLFLLDRSRANRGRWCSMAACGNREKARRHYERHHTSG